jgi:RND superfamily putative drug exporter
MRRPWPVLIVAVALLAAMALPALTMRTGIDLGVRAYAGEASVVGLARLQRAFPNGAPAPVDTVITAPRPADLTAAQQAAERLMGADRRLTAVGPRPLDRTAAVVSGAPLVATDSPAASDVVRDLRRGLETALPADAQAFVGGQIAEKTDFADQLHSAIPKVVLAALLLCFVVLLLVFRSPFLALKAVLANLLSIGASFGLVVLVFQEGWGEGILGFTSPGFLQAYIPLALFVLVYGLSMDYEVFIVTRMREEYERTGDTETAIAVGLERTGGVVTSAAAIMVAVFSAFLLTRVPEIKQFGFGLGAAIAIDATIVRAALVPAVMRIAGRWNWWQPRWLGRLLDRVPLAPEASS